MRNFLNKILKKIKKVQTFIVYRRRGYKIHWKSEVNSSSFGDAVIVSHHASVNNSMIGSYSSIGRFSKVNRSKIGAYSSISWDVTIGATSHPLDHLTTHAFPYVPYAGNFVTQNTQKTIETTIGHDVWIGCNSVVMPGVNIGNGAVIGAGSVVTKDVPPYAIVAGVPAKQIKYRFEEEIIRELQNIKWWDWSRSEIIENIDLFNDALTTDTIEEIKQRRFNH